MDNFDSGSGNTFNLYNPENCHNIVLFLCLFIFTQCFSVESANNCFKVKIKKYLNHALNVFGEYDMQEDKSWSGNVIVDFFNFIHSPEECQNLCKVGLFCYINLKSIPPCSLHKATSH